MSNCKKQETCVGTLTREGDIFSGDVQQLKISAREARAALKKFLHHVVHLLGVNLLHQLTAQQGTPSQAGMLVNVNINVPHRNSATTC